MAADTLEFDHYHLPTEFARKVFIHRQPTGEPERWRQIKKLGSEGFVYLQSETTTGALRAVKKIVIEELAAKNLDFRRELRHLIAVRDRKDLFVQLQGWFTSEGEDLLYLVMEYFEHGDLGGYIASFGPQNSDTAKSIARQLLSGLAVLHGRGICHRDIKPQNILVASVSPIHVKIADLGISKSTSGTTLHTLLGTRPYLAPELQGWGPAHIPDYTMAVDIWALGIAVHEVLTTKGPFSVLVDEEDSDSEEGGVLGFDHDGFWDFCEGRAKLPVGALREVGVGEDGVGFVGRLLRVEPGERLTAEEALEDGWLVGLSQD